MSAAGRLRVRVQPRAGVNEIAGSRAGMVLVRVTAPPEGGKANDAVRKLVARRLRIGVTRVRVVHGAGAREKVLEVEGLTDAELRASFPC